MNRRDFLNKTCMACMSGLMVSQFLSSCQSYRHISGKMNNDGVLVSLDEFKADNNSFHSYVIVRNDVLQYPICVYRFGETEFTALWMRCTHQGTELQASGDALQCPAHGSEFNNRGKVTSGPADTDLRIFPVTILQNEIFIDLRKP